MKLIKLYLIVVSLLIIIAIGCGVYVWAVLQRLDAEEHRDVNAPTPRVQIEAGG